MRIPNEPENWEELPDWPEEMRVSGSLRQWQAVVHDGPELVGLLWKSEPGVLRIDGYPYDQATTVLEGTVVLRPGGGTEMSFGAGETFFLPKGFSGEWEMPENYREYLVVERTTFFAHEG